jgi:hypothetical protein
LFIIVKEFIKDSVWVPVDDHTAEVKYDRFYRGIHRKWFRSQYLYID